MSELGRHQGGSSSPLNSHNFRTAEQGVSFHLGSNRIVWIGIGSEGVMLTTEPRLARNFLTIAFAGLAVLAAVLVAVAFV